jgi:hypothetical protein
VVLSDDRREVSRRHPYPLPADPLKVPRFPQPVGAAQLRRTSAHLDFEGTETANRFRPFARRRLMIARPFAVRIRTRKPWPRFRRMRLG